ncbi:MAG TPA: translation initiation factor IF-2 [Vicinamibacteria bacterium]|nr:translation initiation factor IF-2 [Vicinamibacteria bacterium]
MTNVRVFQLARDLGLQSQDVIDRLKKLGVDAKTASSSVDEDTADKLKRAVKIDALTAKKKRVYGSEEDEAERDAEARALADRIATEKAEREQAAQVAKEAAEARKAGKKRPARAEAGKVEAAETAPALLHRPGAPRLAPKTAAPVVVPVDERPGAEEEAAEPSPAPAPAAPAVPVAAAPVAPAPPARLHTTVPRMTGPLRPIAPAAAPAPPVASAAPAASVSPAPPAVAARPAPVARQIRPLAPPRPISPHPTGPHPVAGSPLLPRSPHPVSPRGGVMPLGLRPASPIPGARRPGAPGPPPMGPPPRARKDRAKPAPPPPVEQKPVFTGPPRKISLTEAVTVKELSEKMTDVKSRDIMKALIQRGVMATVNQSLDPQLAMEICREFNYEATIQSFEETVVFEQEEKSDPKDLLPRAPVITVMGHVDHGKTSLLDAIRETQVAAGEAGGITQHIGAYQVHHGEGEDEQLITFLDTPGHEAFTAMRARGARVTDIVVLVVAADDGVMPQTLEAMDHAKAAGVPIVVAVNKIDKAEAQPDRVKQQLSDRGLMPEEWGGDTVFVNVSAKKRQNLDQLLEMLLLVADLKEFKANPRKAASGTVLEARLDKGRGPVATVLVQDGTLRVGDTVVAGAVAGKVRALMDDQGQRLELAGPATPAEILGLGALPEPGDQLLVVTDSVKAQSIVNFRQLKLREKAMAASSKVRLEDLSRAIAEGQLKELALVIKADVQGSIEAVVDQFHKLPQDKIKLRVIRSGVGAITESDVLLAQASNAVVVGFNVRPERKAAEAAEQDKIEIRLYTVIYDAVDEMKKAMEGLLEPTLKEVRLGAAEVRDTFKISKVGTIAGCYVQDGKVTRQAHVRLLRDNVVIYTGRVGSLKRFKDDASEVKAGLECGIGIAGYNDVKPGDVIEFFVTEKVKETLE